MNNYNRSQIRWGIILIGLGILFLLNTMGIITHFNWGLLLHFWPVIIIIIGINIILKNTPLWWLTPIVFVLGIIGLFIVGNGSTYYQYDYDFSFSSPFADSDLDIYSSKVEIDQAIDTLKLDLNFSSGKLILDSVKDDGILYEARLKYKNDTPLLDYSYEGDEKTAYVTITQAGKSFNWFNFSARNDWELYLTQNIPLIINVNAGAGEFNFSMEELIVQRVTLNSGAGGLEIDLGSNMHYLELNSAAANVKLNIPYDKGFCIKTNGLISNNNFTELGLIKVDNDFYQSPNYPDSNNKLTIKINSSASNIDINFYRMD